jgi:hypothetical protein
MVDLNSLVVGGSNEHLYTANDINDRGEITGQSLSLETGEFSAAWAIPMPAGNGHDNDSASNEISTEWLPPRPEAAAILAESGGLSNGKTVADPGSRSPARARVRVMLPVHVRAQLLQSLGLSEATFAKVN